MEILKDAMFFYKKYLVSNKIAQAFLKNRGIQGNTALFFELGATGTMGHFISNMENHFGYTLEDLEKAKLIRVKDGQVFDVFYNAIIIPIRDIEGNVVNITSRKYDDSDCKYINLPSTPILDFFGVELISNRFMYDTPVGFNNPIILSEGQFDTITLQQNGLPAIGVLGVTNIREEMFNHFQWFDSVIFCFDNDDPGDKARDRVASAVKNVYPNMPLFTTNLGIYNDANDYFQAGRTQSSLIESITKLEGVEPKPLKRERKKGAYSGDTSVDGLKKIEITEFLSTIQNVEFTEADNTLKCICPLPKHKDTNGSFTIYLSNNTYYCFGCNSGGDVIQLCMEMFDLEFKKALMTLNKWQSGRGKNENTGII